MGNGVKCWLSKLPGTVELVNLGCSQNRYVPVKCSKIICSLLLVSIVFFCSQARELFADPLCPSGRVGPEVRTFALDARSSSYVSDGGGRKNGVAIRPGLYRIRYLSGAWTNRHSYSGTWHTSIKVTYLKNGTYQTLSVGLDNGSSAAQVQQQSVGLEALFEVDGAVNGQPNVFIYLDDVYLSDNGGAVQWKLFEGCIGSCNDQVDNDGDGLVDAFDAHCWSDPTNPATYVFSRSSEGTPQFTGCNNSVLSLSAASGVALVNVYERTGGVTSATSFSMSNPALYQNIPDNGTQFDIRSSQSEFYDVYVSDAHGNVNTAGSYLTVDAFTAQSAAKGEGNTIDGVSLILPGGREFPAEKITHAVMGQGADPLSSGRVHRALGQDDGVASLLGLGRSTITFGFCAALDSNNVGCDGVLFSGKGVDQCGVCGGDGTSCAPIVPREVPNPTPTSAPTATPVPCTLTSISSILGSLNADAQERFANVHSARLKKLYRNDPGLQHNTVRRVKKVVNNNVKIKQLLLSVPPLTSTCASMVCVSSNNSEALVLLEKLFNQVHRANLNIVRSLKRNKILNNASRKELNLENDAYLSTAVSVLESIPIATSTCQ